ncbi:MAG: polymer-forming cytoskeletal protein [Anaerolineae bacterium]
MLFGKKRTDTVAAGSIDNILGPNTSFEGTITSDGNIRIEGVYRGRIETAGNLIVGPSGKVLADVVASVVQIQGALRGNVTAQKRLEILPEGRVWGDIEVGSLLIDKGGMFRGQCVMGGEEVEPLTLPGTIGETEEGASQSVDRGEEQGIDVSVGEVEGM